MSVRRGYSTEELIDLVAAPDIRDDAWYQFVLDIADLTASEAYPWANKALKGIAATVARTHVVTEAQLDAVARIIITEWSPSRLYDPMGFGEAVAMTPKERDAITRRIRVYRSVAHNSPVSRSATVVAIGELTDIIEQLLDALDQKGGE